MADPTIVLITGGNTGIGYETVKALYSSPDTAHTILMGSRSLEKAAVAIETLKSEVPESKSSLEAVQIDIEDDESIAKAFEQVKRKWGRVDVLVNNAGLSFSPFFNSHQSIDSGRWGYTTNSMTYRRSIRHPNARRLLHRHPAQSLG